MNTRSSELSVSKRTKEALAAAKAKLTVVLELLGNGKIRVRTSS